MRFSRLLLLVALAVAVPASAQIQGVGYRLTPSANYVDFSKDSGLSDGLLYGGGVGFSFGEFVELGGTYQLGSFDTEFTGLTGFADSLSAPFAALPSRRVGVQRYGGALKLNLARTFIVPYVTAGTGIVRLAPDGMDATRSIYLLGGAGVQFTAFDRFAISVAAEDFAYRYNVGSTLFTESDLAATGLAAEDFEQRTVHNFGARVAASVYLGGRRPGQLTDIDRAFQRQFSGGLTGLSLVVEPYYGRVTFNDAFAYRDQTFVGAEAGFDFGPLVGLRGYYGRGTATNPTDFESIQMIGGDLRLRLSEGRGLVPFLTVGGGYLNVLEGYATDEGADPTNAAAEDNPFATAGAGIGVLVTPRLRGIAEVRGIVMSTSDEDDLSQPDDVYVSPMFRAGVSFGIGGRSGSDIAVVRQSELDAERDAIEVERMQMLARRDSLVAEVAALEAKRSTEREAAVAREADLMAGVAARLDSARMAGDSLAVARLTMQQDSLRMEAMAQTDAALRADSLVAARFQSATDSLTAENAALRRQLAARQPDARMETAPEAEHMVTIPLPREGELYVRYGPPGGVVIEDGAMASGLSETDLRAAIRASLIDVLADDPATTTLTEADVAEIEQRVVDRMLAPRVARAPAASVTAADLERMERRLEDRLLRAIQTALTERDAAAGTTPQN